MEKSQIDYLTQFITEPGTKLRFLAKHRLVKETEAHLLWMAKNLTTSFWWDGYHDHHRQLFADMIPKEVDGQPYREKNHEKVYLYFGSKTGLPSDYSVAAVNIEGMRRFLGWEAAQLCDFLRPMIQRVCQQSTDSERHPYMRHGMREMAKLYFNPDDALIKEVEVWSMRVRIRSGDWPGEIPPAFGLKKDESDDDRRTLDSIVDKLLELGQTNEEICEDMFCAVKRVFTEGYHYIFAVCFAGAKCFLQSKKKQSQLGDYLRSSFRRKMWANCLLSEDKDERRQVYLENFVKLLGCGMNVARSQRSRVEKEFYRPGLVCLIANGLIARAWQIIQAIGPQVLFQTSARNKESIKKLCRRYFLGLVPEAYRKAFDAGQFGLATALGETFGAYGCITDQSVAVEAGRKGVTAEAMMMLRNIQFTAMRDLAVDLNQKVAFQEEIDPYLM